jgi:hypothetical protein
LAQKFCSCEQVNVATGIRGTDRPSESWSNSANERNDGPTGHSTARVSDGRRCDGRCCCRRGTRSKRAGHGPNRQRAKGIGGQSNARAFGLTKFWACGAGTRIQPLGKSRGRDGRRARDRPRNCGRTGRKRARHRRDRHRWTCFSRLQRTPHDARRVRRDGKDDPRFWPTSRDRSCRHPGYSRAAADRR